MREIQICATHRQLAKIIGVLLKGQATRSQITQKTGFHRNFVSRVLIALKGERAVYIVDWDYDSAGRRNQAIFTLGNEDDAPRPPPKTKAERDAKGYRKAKQLKQAASAQPIKTQFVGSPLWQ